MKFLLVTAGALTFVTAAAVIGAVRNAPPSQPPSYEQQIAKQRRDACVTEQYHSLVDLVDKPWRTGELVQSARNLCDHKGIYEPRS